MILLGGVCALSMITAASAQTTTPQDANNSSIILSDDVLISTTGTGTASYNLWARNNGIITATTNNFSLTSQSTSVLYAQSGGQITLDGTGGFLNITGGVLFAGGGIVHATGANSLISLTGAYITTSQEIGGSVTGAYANLGATLSLTDTTISLTGSSTNNVPTGIVGFSLVGTTSSANLSNVTFNIATTSTSGGSVAILVTDRANLTADNLNINLTSGGRSGSKVGLSVTNSQVTISDLVITGVSTSTLNATVSGVSVLGAASIVTINGGTISGAGITAGISANSYGTINANNLNVSSSKSAAITLAQSINSGILNISGGNYAAPANGSTTVSASHMGKLTIKDGAVISNIGSTNATGGYAVYAYSTVGASSYTDIILDDAIIDANGYSATYRVIGAYAAGSASTITMDNSTINVSGGVVSLSGLASYGVLVNGTGTSFTGTNSTITFSRKDASTTIYGAAVQAQAGGVASLDGMTIQQNGNYSYGIAATGTGSKITVTNTSVTSPGTAINGAGLAVSSGGELHITGSTVSFAGTGSYGALLNGISGTTNILSVTDTELTSTGAAAIAIAEGTTGDVTLNGTGTSITGNGIWLNVSGAGSYGDIIIRNGATVRGAAFTATGNTADVAMSFNAVWEISGASQLSNLSVDAATIKYIASGTTLNVTNEIQLKSGGGTFDTNGYDNTLATKLTDVGALTKTGSGTLTLTAVNDYAGGTTVAGGVLRLIGDGAIGAGIAQIDAGGTLFVDLPNSGDYAFNNELIGNGTLQAALADTTKSFDFGISVGTGFTGTFRMGTGRFDLSGNNTAVLTNATLQADTGSIVTVGAGSQAVGNLTFNGGRLHYADVSVPADINTADLVTTGNVSVTSNGGIVAVDTAVAGIVIPTTPSDQLNLLSQDDNAQVKLIDASGTVTGAGGLTLTDLDGNVISMSNHQVDIISGGQTVAVGSYDYIFSGKDNDGVYLGYGLKQLDLQSGQTLTLTPDLGASGGATDMSAKITGSGNLAIDAAGASDGIVSLSNATNDYRGITHVLSGTLQMANDRVLGLTSDLQILSGTTFDMNGFSQAVGAIHVASGGELNLTSGSTLTITDAQRAVDDTDGGALENNTLFGSGTLVIDPSILHVNGVQQGFTGNIQITGGSELQLNNVNAFDTTTSIEVVGAEDKVIFTDLAAYNPNWTSEVTGTTAASFKGAGSVEATSGSDITLAGNSSGFSGLFIADTNAVLRASAQQNIGTASIQADGIFNFDVISDPWHLDNAVTGSGEVLKTGNGALIVNQALAGFTGLTQIDSGAFVVGDSSTTGALVTGSVNVASGAVLSGTGTVEGPVRNDGEIVAYNVFNSAAAISNLTVGPLANAGSINLAGSEVGNTLTVVGGLTSQKGTVTLNTVLGDDASKTDRLILDGGATTGSTNLIIHNQNGAGGQTVIGIQVVEARNGATTQADSFVLDPSSDGYRSTTATLASGAYDYQLIRGGHGGDANSWYLSSSTQEISSGNGNGNGGGQPVYRPEAGVYLAQAQVARSMFLMTFHDREGYVQMNSAGQAPKYAGWARIVGSHENSRAANNALSTSTGTVKAQMGLDLFQWESQLFGSFYAGIMGGWGHSELEAKSRQGSMAKANGKTDGYSVGVYGTWYQNDKGQGGAYVDTWAQYSWFNNEVRGIGLPVEKFDSQAFTASIEGGYSLLLNESDNFKLFLEPQAQLAYVSYHSDSHNEVNGTRVRYKAGNGLIARIGARLYSVHMTGRDQIVRPYIEANYWYNQKGGKLYMNNDLVPGNTPRSSGEIKAGLAAQINKNFQIWGDVGARFGGNKYSSFTAQAGLKYSW
ncbi:autotransporter outer membrane beta-barrel domain-containing protein [Microvirga sp. W0021]|uniref:Autotransporter outer membrane beta-barrel domain-containing protein n=1 Tax=Hohaiivirga grylli TaxID=3133970 RepID=A0ABV0BJT2_9HYPH